MAHSESNHHKNDHPFHIVDLSPWPFLSCIALFILPLGAVLSMHGKQYGEYVLGAGLLMVLYVMYGWWRDVLVESKKDPVHTKEVQVGLRMGMALFIASEVMFFVAFFWAYFNASLFPVAPLSDIWAMAEGVWPPEGITTFDPWHLPFLNTMILLLSGTTVTWAHHALLHGENKGVVTGLAITVALGAIFSTLQMVEYSHAAFGFKDGVYASTFYLATGFHGLHVFIGTIFLAVNLVRAMRNNLTKEHHLGFEFAAWYWHFVDVVWLFLFAAIYWWGA